jgi:hypothetical protein
MGTRINGELNRLLLQVRGMLELHDARGEQQGLCGLAPFGA